MTSPSPPPPTASPPPRPTPMDRPRTSVTWDGSKRAFGLNVIEADLRGDWDRWSCTRLWASGGFPARPGGVPIVLRSARQSRALPRFLDRISRLGRTHDRFWQVSLASFKANDGR